MTLDQLDARLQRIELMLSRLVTLPDPEPPALPGSYQARKAEALARHKAKVERRSSNEHRK